MTRNWTFVKESGLPPKKDDRGVWPEFWCAMKNGEVKILVWSPKDRPSRGWAFFDNEMWDSVSENVTKYVIAYMPLDTPKHPDSRFNCPKCHQTISWPGSKETTCWPCKLKLNWDEEKGWVIAK